METKTEALRVARATVKQLGPKWRYTIHENLVLLCHISSQFFTSILR